MFFFFLTGFPWHQMSATATVSPRMSATDLPERQQRSLARELGLDLPKLESLRVRPATTATAGTNGGTNGGTNLGPDKGWLVQVESWC